MMTHIVFGATTKSLFNSASEYTPGRLLGLDDDLMSGPLGKFSDIKTMALRVSWWPTLAFGPARAFLTEALQENWTAFWSAIAALTSNDSLVIWAADNPTEQTGLRAVLAAIEPTIPVKVVNVTRAFEDRYPRSVCRSIVPVPIYHTFNVRSEHIASLASAQQPLSSQQRTNLLNNWRQLLREDGILRQYTPPGSVTTVSPGTWDPFILEQAKNLGMEHHWVRTVRLVGECLGNQHQCISDLFIFWRIRCLIERNLLWCRGPLDSMRTTTLALPV